MIERVPNLIVAGVSKAGTSSLFEYLGRHPEVGQSDVKEVRYFTPLRHGENLAPIEEYTAHFTGLSQPYVMEATPGYFYGGSLLADSMKMTCSGLSVIVSLREPVSRCWSWYRFEKSRMRLPKETPFDEYVETCIRLHELGVDGLPVNQPFWGVGGGCYDRWLEDWIEVMGEDLKVAFFDDLTRDPSALMVDLFEWLELDPQAADLSDLKAVNTTQQYKIKSAQKIAVKVNRRGESFFRRHPQIKRTLRAGYYTFNRQKPTEQMPDAARERLEDFYQPHNEKLAKQLDAIGLMLPTSWTEKRR